MEISDNVDEVLFEGLEMAYLGSKKIIENFSTFINYSINSMDTEAIWNKLIHTGYLSFEPSNKSRTRGFAVIPNKELRMHWKTELQKLLMAKIGPADLPEMLISLQEFNLDDLSSVVGHLIESGSFHDFSSGNSYHMAFYSTLKLAAKGKSNIRIATNRESGYGRFDVAVEFVTEKRAVIFEFKKASSVAELDAAADTALQQIKDKNYGADFKDCTCLIVGVAFRGKHMSAFKTKVLPPSLKHIPCK